MFETIIISIGTFVLGCILGEILKRRNRNTKVGTPSASHNSAMVPCQHKFYPAAGWGFVECKYCGETFDVEAQPQ